MSLGLNFGHPLDSVVLLAGGLAVVVVGAICLLTARTLLQVSMLTDVMLSLDILSVLTLPHSVALALARSLLLRDVSIELDVTNIRVRDIGTYYKGPFPNGRSLTRAAYAEFSSADIRHEVFDAIGGFNDKPVKLKCSI